ncbi:MAG: SDR family NAD(P)-dependent oxidoreductase [Myxococcota bacterium]
MKRVVMTGGTQGIGAEALARLLEVDCEVVLAARDPSGLPTHGRLQVEKVDLSALAQVRAFARSIERADVLIANAGVQVVSGDLHTEEGHELSFGVNHLAHFLLLMVLLPKLETGGRVLFTGSGTHDPNEHLARLFGFRGGRYTTAERLARGDVGDDRGPRLLGMDRYATSKLCNLMIVNELARRVPAERMGVFSFDPGLVPATGLARDHAPWARRVYSALAPGIARLPGASTPKKSGRALAWTALTDELHGRSGEHFGYQKRHVHVWSGADDRERCRELFDTSLQLTGTAFAP